MLHGLLQAQAGHHVVLGGKTDLACQPLANVVDDAFDGLPVLDAHQRHGPALGDGKAQGGLCGQALTGQQRECAQR
ncbi:hypothetical protein D3C86_2021580 [compost metagenome]